MKLRIFFLLFTSCLSLDDYKPEGPLKLLGFGKFASRKKFGGDDLLFDAFNGKNPLEVMTKEFKFDKDTLMKKIELKKFEMHAEFFRDLKNASYIPLPPIPADTNTATADISIYNPLFTFPTDQIIFIEYLNETKTEIRVSHELISAALSKNQEKEAMELKLYENSIDEAIYSDGPCKLENLGKVVELDWLEKFANVTLIEGNSTRFYVNEKLLTGQNSIIGKTFFANVLLLGSMCGTVRLNETVKENFTSTTKPVLYGATFNRIFDGIVKISQHLYQNKSNEIFEVEYYLRTNGCVNNDRKDVNDTVSNITNFTVPGIGSISERTLYSCENELLDENLSKNKQDKVVFNNFGPYKNSTRLLPVGKSCHIQHNIFTELSGIDFGNDTLQLVITKNNSTECVQLEKWEEIPFRYTVFTTQEYEDIQEEMAGKISAHPYQFSIDYSRELFEDICSILNVTFTGTPTQINQFYTIFNVTDYRFSDADSLNCTSSDKINNEFAIKSLKKYLALIAIPLMILMFGALLLAATMGA